MAKRVPCEFCPKTFVNEEGRDRHSRELHRRAFNLVRVLRGEIKDLRLELDCIYARDAGASI